MGMWSDSVRACRWCALACFWVVMARSGAVAQVEAAKPVIEDKPDSFLFDAISFAGNNSPMSRIDIFVQVGYDILSFVKQDDKYYASYELTIGIYDSIDGLVAEKTWTEEIKGATFEESISSRLYSLTQRIFVVQPGRYTISAILRDVESKTSRRLSRKLLVSNYAVHPFSLSDIMLVSRVTQKEEKRSIVPIVGSNVGSALDGFYAFFEAYNDTSVDSVRLVAAIADSKGEHVYEVDTVEPVHAGRNELMMRLSNASLALGDYMLYIQAFPTLAHGGVSAPHIGATNRTMIVRWRGIPRGVKDLDVAIEQLRYVAKDEELDPIKEAKTTEEKQKKFFEFWKKRDPNPNTPRNEKMEEFYARVDYANKHFSHYIEGWRTDMGMVYIIFGPPNSVDRHPYDMDAKPYEVWSYFEMNHQFIFVDQTGFGDYRLVTPIWEVWRRPGN
jgi:GWxTD domain-containing protein